MYVTELPENIVKFFANDIYFVVTAKDSMTQKIFGFALYLVAPYYPQGLFGAAIWR